MSRQQKLTQEDNAKIINDTTAENLRSTIQCAPANLSVRTVDKNKQSSTKLINKNSKQSHSDGNIIKNQDTAGLKQKLVNKVKSWNNKDKLVQNDQQTNSKAEANFISDMEALNLSNENSEDNLCKSDWLRAKDSLENLLEPRNDKMTSGDITNSRSTSFPSSSQDKLLSDSSHSDPFLVASKPSPSNSVSKVLTWDPWDKLGRKNKKDNKRRKWEKSPLQSRENSRQRISDVESSRKDHTAGDEVRPKIEDQISVANNDVNQEEISYEYKPYQSQNGKSVDFINEVMVVYFTGDEVINECTEPLKKELDQQIRNKEMRRGHMPAMLMGKKRLCEDYMAAWFKK